MVKLYMMRLPEHVRMQPRTESEILTRELAVEMFRWRTDALEADVGDADELANAGIILPYVIESSLFHESLLHVADRFPDTQVLHEALAGRTYTGEQAFNWGFALEDLEKKDWRNFQHRARFHMLLGDLEIGIVPTLKHERFEHIVEELTGRIPDPRTEIAVVEGELYGHHDLPQVGTYGGPTVGWL